MGERCGFCVKAEALLADEIKAGRIKKLPASEAPPGIDGFPAFVLGDKKHMGLPSSKEALYKSLGYVAESYSHGNVPDCMTPPMCGGVPPETREWWTAGVL